MRARLGLVVDPHVSDVLGRFIEAAVPWCEPVYAPAGGDADAWLVAPAPSVPSHAPRLVEAGPPRFALWAESAAVLDDPLIEQAAVIVTPDPLTAASVPAGIVVARDGRSFRDIPWLPPHVRARWRRRFGLPDPLVATLGGPHEVHLPSRLRSTLLGVASAAVVSGDAVLDALAWGVPTVTDEATRVRFDLVPNEHVLVEADHAAAQALAVELSNAVPVDAAGSPIAATAMSLAGRRHVIDRFELGTAALQMLDTLGLVARAGTDLERVLADSFADVVESMDELAGTPVRAMLDDLVPWSAMQTSLDTASLARAVAGATR